MVKTWKAFALGALFMLVLMVAGYLVYTGTDRNLPGPSGTMEETGDKITITPLPTLRIIRGMEVPFTGKAELRQAIAGRAARNLAIVNFQATGEHAEKSFIKIVWENGEVDTVYPGQAKQFAEDRRAVEIVIQGYSMHERRIFRDSSRQGTLTWEIRYEPVE